MPCTSLYWFSVGHRGVLSVLLILVLRWTSSVLLRRLWSCPFEMWTSYDIHAPADQPWKLWHILKLLFVFPALEYCNFSSLKNHSLQNILQIAFVRSLTKTWEKCWRITGKKIFGFILLFCRRFSSANCTLSIEKFFFSKTFLIDQCNILN